MLHKVNSTYREIAKYFPELNTRLSPSAYKKQTLLEMARRGEPRPKFENPLGSSLSSYTIKSSDNYDPKFDKEIRKLRPEWFKVEHKKQLLLEMGRKRRPKPRVNTSIGAALRAYTRKSSNCYDPKFHGEIKKLAPGWFVSNIEMANQKRKVLVEMARKGKPKPDATTILGRVLGHYTRQSSSCYQAKFDSKIRRLRPDWFVSKIQRANEKKQTLLGMAKRGGPRPDRKTNPFGMALSTYTIKSSSSYDAKFDREIRRLRPEWFVLMTERADEKKQLLLKMARTGKTRPRQKTPIGRVLGFYTCSKTASYDPKFDREIRKLRPEWFVSPTERANENKRLLMEMARKGSPKPGDKTLLGRNLRGYTKKSSKRHDPKFDREIRKTNPEWFVVRSSQKKDQLLEMARKGRPKPHFDSSLAKALSSYTIRSSQYHDPVFEMQIKKIAPGWFVSKSEKRKNLLLEMARKGEPKPKWKTASSSALSSYAIKSSNYYDPKFAREIKRLAPHWFRKGGPRTKGTGRV